MARARAGEAAALEEIVRHHAPRVFRVVAGHLGRAEAEDATQEVFLLVSQGIRRFEGRSQLSTWIHRIATNVALKRHRRRRRKPPPDSLDAAAVASAGPGPLVEASGRELEAELRRALDALPEDQRAVVVLRGVEGLSFAEVAAALGIPEPTAHSRMSRARECLRRFLRPFLEPLAASSQEEP